MIFTHNSTSIVDREKLLNLEDPDKIHEFVLESGSSIKEKKALSAMSDGRIHERMFMLHVIDSQWKDHLYGLDHLKEGIGFRGYGQRDPLVEYKKESFALFEEMMNRMEEDIVRYVFLDTASASDEAAPPRPAPSQVRFSGPSLEARLRVGRNQKMEKWDATIPVLVVRVKNIKVAVE